MKSKLFVLLLLCSTFAIAQPYREFKWKDSTGIGGLHVAVPLIPGGILGTSSGTYIGFSDTTNPTGFLPYWWNGKFETRSDTNTTKHPITLNYAVDNFAPITLVTNWNTAYTDRLKWDGGSTGLIAATGRTSLGLNNGAMVDTVEFGNKYSPIAGSSSIITTGVLASGSLATGFTTIDTALTNAVSKITVKTGILVTKIAKDYVIEPDTTFLITKNDTAGFGGGTGGSGTVTSVATGDKLTGGTITTTGTINVDTTVGKIETQTMAAKFQLADYVIEKIGSTYYANPNIGTSHTAYSGAAFATVMNSAITQLTSGGNIFVKPGTYYGADSIGITNLSNIKIEGAGDSLTVFTSAGVANRYRMIKLTGTLNNIEICGIKFISTATDATERDYDALIYACDLSGGAANIFNDIKIHDCSFTCPNVNVDAIKLSAEEVPASRTNNLSIYNNKFFDIGRMAVEILNWYDMVTSRIDCGKVYNNHFDGLGLQGTYGQAVSFGGYNTNTSIKDNIMADLYVSENVFIELSSCHNGNVSFNKINNTTYHPVGIYISSDDLFRQYSEHISVVGNTINFTDPDTATELGTPVNGISVTHTRYLNIEGNSVKASIPLTVGYTFYSTVVGNSFIIQGWSGIAVNDSTQYSTFSNNTIDAYHLTSDFDGAAYIYISGANIINNQFIDNLLVPNVETNPWYVAPASTNILGNIFQSKVSLKKTATVAGASAELTPGNNFTTITSANSAYWCTLPFAHTNLIGIKIRGRVTANGCKIRTESTQEASVYLNDVTGAVAAVTIPANSSFEATLIDVTHWVVKVSNSVGWNPMLFSFPLDSSFINTTDTVWCDLPGYALTVDSISVSPANNGTAVSIVPKFLYRTAPNQTITAIITSPATITSSQVKTWQSTINQATLPVNGQLGVCHPTVTTKPKQESIGIKVH
jgi:hypothetical protein